jgi:hypothetical protein
MSSPHVAGGVALLLEARPRIAAGDVRDALLPTAAPKPWWGNPGLGFLDNVHRQGAGMLQIDKAVRATTRLWPTALHLGENETGAPVTHRIWVVNGGSVPVTYRISHEGALATGPNTFSPAFFATFAAVAFSTTELTVPAGEKRFVDVTITPPAGLATRGVYGGYIVFAPADGGQTYRAAYAGFKGDYQGFDVLTPTPLGFPWLARLVGTSFVRQGPGATFTFTGDDVAYVLFHLDHQASQVRLTAVAPTGRVHDLFRFDFVGRNSTATSFFFVPWDGRDSAGIPVPDGEYTLQLWVLKPLGEKHLPGHTQEWFSPTFFIDRP